VCVLLSYRVAIVRVPAERRLRATIASSTTTRTTAPTAIRVVLFVAVGAGVLGWLGTVGGIGGAGAGGGVYCAIATPVNTPRIMTRIPIRNSVRGMIDVTSLEIS
jgi:hypothetical protein